MTCFCQSTSDFDMSTEVFYFLAQDTGFTALMLASQGGHLDTVLTLLDYSSNASIKNKVRLCTCSGEDYVHVIVLLTLTGWYDCS